MLKFRATFMFPPFKNDYRHYTAVSDTEPGVTFSPFLFVTISSLISSRFTKKSFRQGANRWATVSRCRCEIITTWSTMNLLWEEIFQAGLECGRKMKTERTEEKREVVPASPLLRPRRLYRALEKRNKFSAILFSFFDSSFLLPFNKTAFT